MQLTELNSTQHQTEGSIKTMNRPKLERLIVMDFLLSECNALKYVLLLLRFTTK